MNRRKQLAILEKRVNDLEAQVKSLGSSTSARRARTKTGIPNSHRQILAVWADDQHLAWNTTEIMDLCGLPLTQQPRLSNLKANGCLRVAFKVGHKEYLTITDKGLAALRNAEVNA